MYGAPLPVPGMRPLGPDSAVNPDRAVPSNQFPALTEQFDAD